MCTFSFVFVLFKGELSGMHREGIYLELGEEKVYSHNTVYEEPNIKNKVVLCVLLNKKKKMLI